MDSVSPDAAAWIQALERMRRDVSAHRTTVDTARDLLAGRPASAVFAQQPDDVYWGTSAAVSEAPFLHGRSRWMSRIAADAWAVLEQAIGALEDGRAMLRQPEATVGAVAPALHDASRLLGATDARIAARLSELTRLL